jgi:hypothetical protein
MRVLLLGAVTCLVALPLAAETWQAGDVAAAERYRVEERARAERYRAALGDSLAVDDERVEGQLETSPPGWTLCPVDFLDDSPDLRARGDGQAATLADRSGHGCHHTILGARVPRRKALVQPDVNLGSVGHADLTPPLATDRGVGARIDVVAEFSDLLAKLVHLHLRRPSPGRLILLMPPHLVPEPDEVLPNRLLPLAELSRSRTGGVDALQAIVEQRHLGAELSQVRRGGGPRMVGKGGNAHGEHERER